MTTKLSIKQAPLAAAIAVAGLVFAGMLPAAPALAGEESASSMSATQDAATDGPRWDYFTEERSRDAS